MRDVERIVQEDAERGLAQKGKGGAKRAGAEKDADTRALESTLMAALGLKVSLVNKGESGELRIAYASLEQLDAVCRRLKGEG